ncbi:MAG TPA: MFS transporter [Kofleriaceae bacterium]|jgi:MFS family permease|nr:MFS transporter [Kofleriaceae bacterium]
MARPRSPLLPIFLIVFVDVLGFTIVIPLLSLYAERFGASKLVATTIVSVYAVCSLISTPVIGNLSDRYGRRPLLLVSQAGTCAGFVILGISNALWMVFLGRILDGITAGNLSTAQAYISDHTKPEDRAKSFGIIGIAFGIGFMFGPGMGGWLSAQYGMHMPFIVSACLSFVSIVCTWTLLPRELPPQDGKPAAVATANAGPAGRRPGAFDISTYVEFFRRPGLGSVYVQYFLFTFAFSCFTSGFALFAEARYGWSARQTGYLFTYAGLLGIFLQGGLIGRLVKRYGEVKLSIAGFGAALVGYVLLGFVTKVTPWQWLAFLLVTATVNGFGSGVLRPVLSSRISQMVGRYEQGVALGIAGSLSSLAMTLAPPSGGTMLDLGWLQGWTTVSATMSLIGLVAAVATRASTRAASAAIASKLPKAEVVKTVPEIVAE